MNEPLVGRDERTVAIENASYRIAYLFLSYGLLMAVVYRSFVLGDTGWDLLALVVAGGVVATGYQGAHRVLSRGWLMTVLMTMAAAFVIAGIIAYARG